MYREGYSCMEVGKTFGKSPAYVHCVIRGKKYAFLDGLGDVNNSVDDK